MPVPIQFIERQSQEPLRILDWRAVVEVNLTGAFLFAKAAIPALRETRGSMIHVSSSVVDHGRPLWGAYCASKNGVEALSEMLAQRAGARLQTLVIDEGFGSQDALGRQRLIEAINLVKDDFAKILVITHIDDLKDAFQNRIEVEKTERGSVIRVL